MLKSIVYTACLCFVCTTITAQKELMKSWDASSFDSVEVISDEVFVIRVVSARINSIEVVIKVEGEHAEQLVLAVSKEQRVLSIAPELRPYFKAPNDKLAAHKVLSIEMEVRVPESFEFYTEAAIASVEARGSFKGFSAQLHDGNCTLFNFKGNADLFTRHGNIKVFAQDGVGAIVTSQRGKAENKLINPNSIFTVVAKSVNGDVIVMPTQ